MHITCLPQPPVFLLLHWLLFSVFLVGSSSCPLNVGDLFSVLFTFFFLEILPGLMALNVIKMLIIPKFIFTAQTFILNSRLNYLLSTQLTLGCLIGISKPTCQIKLIFNSIFPLILFSLQPYHPFFLVTLSFWLPRPKSLGCPWFFFSSHIPHHTPYGW